MPLVDLEILQDALIRTPPALKNMNDSHLKKLADNQGGPECIARVIGSVFKKREHMNERSAYISKVKQALGANNFTAFLDHLTKYISQADANQAFLDFILQDTNLPSEVKRLLPYQVTLEELMLVLSEKRAPGYDRFILYYDKILTQKLKEAPITLEEDLLDIASQIITLSAKWRKTFELLKLFIAKLTEYAHVNGEVLQYVVGAVLLWVTNEKVTGNEYAIKQQRLDYIKKLVALNKVIIEKNKQIAFAPNSLFIHETDSALFFAALINQGYEMVDAILDAASIENDPPGYKETVALATNKEDYYLLALLKSNKQMRQKLLQVVQKKDMRSLQIICNGLRDQPDLLEYLLSATPVFDKKHFGVVLLESVKRNDTRAVKQFLRQDFNEDIQFHYRDENGNTALHYAVSMNLFEMVVTLVTFFKKRYIMDIANYQGKLPQDLARENGCFVIEAYLKSDDQAKTELLKKVRESNRKIAQQPEDKKDNNSLYYTILLDQEFAATKTLLFKQCNAALTGNHESIKTLANYYRTINPALAMVFSCLAFLHNKRIEFKLYIEAQPDEQRPLKDFLLAGLNSGKLLRIQQAHFKQDIITRILILVEEMPGPNQAFISSKLKECTKLFLQNSGMSETEVFEQMQRRALVLRKIYHPEREQNLWEELAIKPQGGNALLQALQGDPKAIQVCADWYFVEKKKNNIGIIFSFLTLVFGELLSSEHRKEKDRLVSAAPRTGSINNGHQALATILGLMSSDSLFMSSIKALKKELSKTPDTHDPIVFIYFIIEKMKREGQQVALINKLETELTTVIHDVMVDADKERANIHIRIVEVQDIASVIANKKQKANLLVASEIATRIKLPILNTLNDEDRDEEVLSRLPLSDRNATELPSLPPIQISKMNRFWSDEQKDARENFKFPSTSTPRLGRSSD